MAIFKCKMCGGTLEINNNESVFECEYCGTTQTLPKLDDDRKSNMYDRANHFRRNNEFDKAMGIYEQILNEDNTDAEAYWSLVLCRYGIEYVEDPVSHKRVPTVNRAQYTSIFDDSNYKAALEYADTMQKSIYEEEAKTINEIQKGILEISQKEEPFDVFICYKETDSSGRRTPDSVLANDLYHQLTQEGFKVFFARITLEDKLGSAYEPYIFAALNSAKVMVVLGTKPEFFKAVWVRNEWSRYLALIKNGEKKALIPAYKDMDPYDLPEEFSHLQAQDMSKLGFMQVLIRGIKKITQMDEPAKAGKDVVTSSVSADIEPLLKRAFIFLEDSKFDEADEYCEKVLDKDPENGMAYLGKYMVQLKVRQREDLKEWMALERATKPIDTFENYKKVLRYGDEELVNELKGYMENAYETNYNKAKKLMDEALTYEEYNTAALCFKCIGNYKDSEKLWEKCTEIAGKEKKYFDAVEIMNKSADYKNYRSAKEIFESISGYKDSKELSRDCERLAQEEYNNSIYNTALKCTEGRKVGIEDYKMAIGHLRRVIEWKDSREKIEEFEKKIEKILNEERERSEIEENENNRIKKQNKKGIIIAAIFIVFAIILVKGVPLVKSYFDYNSAMSCIEAGDYVKAYEILVGLDGFGDSEEKIEEIRAKKNFSRLKDVKVGDYITFGVYEQDNNEDNGLEEIEWKVLDIEENKILVISKYALDCKPYNSQKKECTWEESFLRNWLNISFRCDAFSLWESDCICYTDVIAHNNPEYNTNSGNDTQDKIFLLSITEVNEYFTTDAARECLATRYAKSEGVYSNENGFCMWWLRTPGDSDDTAAYVRTSGDVSVYGNDVCGLYYDVLIDYGYRDGYAVRPAMWISLES